MSTVDSTPGPEQVTQYFTEFTTEQIRQLEQLYPLYQEWNSKINVISRKDMADFYIHHVLHSLSIAAAFELFPGMKVMDLGCGGGFPGIPLAIFFPETDFLMVDSIRKKLTVVEEVAHSLGLKNIRVQHSRAEELAPRQFDLVVSRAVAPLGELWGWSRPLLKKNKTLPESAPNGLICLKGGDLGAEVSASGTKPFAWPVTDFFQEPWFEQKYILYLPITR